MAPKPCLERGCRELAYSGSYCTEHRRARNRQKMRQRQARGYDNAERKRRADAVTAWIEQHGLVCPGYRKPPHAVASRRELDADHVVPVAIGGEHGPLKVLCHVCNAERGQRGD